MQHYSRMLVQSCRLGMGRRCKYGVFDMLALPTHVLWGSLGSKIRKHLVVCGGLWGIY